MCSLTEAKLSGAKGKTYFKAEVWWHQSGLRLTALQERKKKQLIFKGAIKQVIISLNWSENEMWYIHTHAATYVPPVFKIIKDPNVLGFLSEKYKKYRKTSV